MRHVTPGQRSVLTHVLTALLWVSTAHAQTETAPSGYLPGTPPWVPLIDACMTAGGGRNDCIEALPPDLHAEFLATERARRDERRALLQRQRTPRIPPPERLPDIYRDPTSVPGLPVEIAESLAESGCLIPQSLNTNPNVVVGELAMAGQQDIAVICSVDGSSHVRIFWGGPASCPDLDSSYPDWMLLERYTEWEYHWAIAASSPAHIRGYYDRYPEECPIQDLPPLDHDGLEDITVEKGSSNLYCHEGQWMRLCGAD